MARQSNYSLFKDMVIQGNSNVISDKIAVDLSSGYFAVAGSLSGTNPNIKIEYLTGDENNFILSATPISQNLSAANFQAQFYPDLSKYIKIKVTNNSASQAAVSLNLIFSE